MSNPIVSAVVWFISGAWTCHWIFDHYGLYASGSPAANILAVVASGVGAAILAVLIGRRFQKSN